jgi:hypothetical protein
MNVHSMRSPAPYPLPGGGMFCLKDSRLRRSSFKSWESEGEPAIALAMGGSPSEKISPPPGRGLGVGLQ